MEKRRYKRTTVYLKAERISGDEKYGVFIENISDKGIHMLATHAPYPPGKNIDVKFHIAQRKPLILHCRVRWSCPKVPRNGLTDSIGLEILDPPPQYIEFVRMLH
jgi:PilZ domain